jgi:predicted nuclease with RNAse H fold
MTREDSLAAATRHFKECEQRLARQKTRVAQLEQGGHSDLAAEARSVLKLLEEALQLAGVRLRSERHARGLSD